ncbi:MAG: HPF/RaiA family ribosome-associated protein [Kiritimatiellae bacterium]|jgi:ribosomal subunit interface protein|nr:HPF/RaiA family ribosome-associated protein [Kiritimatiellia bacterium]
MSIEVTLRHNSANEGLKQYAEVRAEKILLQFPKVDSIHVVLDMQRHLFEAEFVVHQKGVTAVGVKEHASSPHAAIDTAGARAEKQLRKLHDKRITVHQGVRA